MFGGGEGIVWIEDGHSGPSHQLIRRHDQLECKYMLRRCQHNTVMCSGHRSNCCGQESLFVLLITGSASGSGHKKLWPERPNPTRLRLLTQWPVSSSTIKCQKVNTKSYMLYRMATFPMPWVTFDLDFKVTTFFKVEYLKKNGVF